MYLSAVIDNAGNYKSFGDTKFVPECSEEVFVKFFKSTPYWAKNDVEFDKIYNRIGKMIFNAETPYALIDFSNNNGTSGYYSKNITSADAEVIKEATIKRCMKSENNRLTKQGDKEFTVKIGSVDAKEEVIEHNGLKIKLQYGEFSPFLKKTNKYLTLAKESAANEIQAKMIDEYI